MKFSQNKAYHQQVKNIPSKDQYKLIVNKPLIILAIIFTLLVGSFLVLPPDIIEKWFKAEVLLTIIAIVLSLSFFLVVIEQINKRKRINNYWHKVEASCILWHIDSYYLGKGKTWNLAILCRYSIGKSEVQLTPKVADMSWFSESGAMKFLDSRVDENGLCELRVNPDDPLDACLVPLDQRMMIFFIVFVVLTILLGWLLL